MEFVNQPYKDGSNPNNNTNAAFDGENGENCGIVKIQNDVKVYAYGGKGGSGGNGVSSSGGRRTEVILRHGIGRRWSSAEVGAMHYDGAGGFSGGRS